MKLTDVPGHTAPAGDPEIFTAGVNCGLMATAIGFELASGMVAQTALDVRTTETTSPLFKELLVKFGELDPAFIPFTFH